MTIEEKLKMYREKRQFIYNVAMAFVKVPKGHSVYDVVYEVFFQEFTEPYRVDLVEWVTVIYDGGGKAHKCVSGNSNSANFQVIASMVDGGCYEQNLTYDLLEGRGYKKLDLNKLSSLQEEK